jgi:hypothetical protein
MADVSRCPYYAGGKCDPKGWNLPCLGEDPIMTQLGLHVPKRYYENCERFKIFRTVSSTTDSLRLAAEKLRLPSLF